MPTTRPYRRGWTTLLIATIATAAVAAEGRGEPPAHGPRTDIREAIALGVSALNNAFDADRDDEPFFYANCRADGTGEFHHSVAIGIPHVVGRALWASRLAEETAGVPFPPRGRAILARYCKLSFDNEDHINSYLDPAKGNARLIELHNLREGLLGLCALISAGGPDADWARDKAAKMIRKVESFTGPDGRLSRERAERAGIAPRLGGLGIDATTSGRFVDALLEYHRLTKDPLAMKLAGLYARATARTAFTPDGRFAPKASSGGHIHSITSSLSGIARYADLADDRELLGLCARVLDVGVPESFSSWGWGDEVSSDHEANVQSRGEVNQTGDVVRAALVLGRRVSPRYYEQAERYIRGTLLPAQLREEDLRSFLKDVPAPKDDSRRDVPRRSVGGYGFPLPNARMREGDWPIFTLDITSGAVHALCEAWRSRVTRDAGVTSINLLFDHDGDDVRVVSRLPFEGRIDITPRVPGPIRLRVPGWLDVKSLSLRVGEQARPLPEIQDGWLPLALGANETASVRFELPHRQADETVDGIRYHVSWIGDQVITIEPRGKVSPLP